MRRTIGPLLVALAVLTACGAGGSASAASSAAPTPNPQADVASIYRLQASFHRAASTKDLDLMMSLWTDTATFTVGGKTYTGKPDIRNWFATVSGAFKPQNNWVSDSPSYKTNISVAGDKGTLRFECHYIDVSTKRVMSIATADTKVARVAGQWLFADVVAGSGTLGS